VRPSPVLLLASVAAGALSVVAALVSAQQTSTQCGAVALAALAARVSMAGRAAAPRVRWALTAGIGLLSLATATKLFWHQDQALGAAWLAPAPQDDARAAIAHHWLGTIDRDRTAATGLLLGVLCLGVAVLALPARHRPRRAAPTVILALVLLAVAATQLGSRAGGTPVLGLLGAAWPAVLATLAAAGMMALSGRRTDRAWLLPAGALLVAVAAAVTLDDLAGTRSAWWALSGAAHRDVMFMVGAPTGGSPQVSGALATAVALGGPALLAIGALRASRDADPGLAAEPWE
jgi:hypothetical protein